MGIPVETILDLLAQEQNNYPDRRTLVKEVRRKLHNIMAVYLEDLDYRQASAWLTDLSAHPDDAAARDVCSRILAAHASSRERMSFLGSFYEQVFAITGKPESILDLACGLHPFSFPWMGLPVTCRHYAYDIHLPRIALINQFFSVIGLQPLAELRDVLVNPPEQTAQAAFLFKEAHRMEKRKPGCSRVFWAALAVRFLVVSLPSTDLSSSHDLSEKHRALVSGIMSGLPWKMTEIAFPNELVFVLDKGGAR